MSSNWVHIEIVVFCALGLLLALIAGIGLMTRIRYRVGSRHVKVLLFGICVRRMALANIASLSKRRADGGAEHWWSTVRPKHRMLVIRKKRGLLRNFIITPKNRYVFRTDIERAMRRAGLVLGGGGREEGSDSDAGTPPEDPGGSHDNEAQPENRKAAAS